MGMTQEEWDKQKPLKNQRSKRMKELFRYRFPLGVRYKEARKFAPAVFRTSPDLYNLVYNVEGRAAILGSYNRVPITEDKTLPPNSIIAEWTD